MSPTRPPHPCVAAGCSALVTEGSKCPHHRAESRKQSDQRRGTARQRGYGSGHQEFRRAVLRRDPRCRECGEPSTVADHWPLSRRELVARGLDPGDPSHGRGLCAKDHNRATAKAQPGGWNRG